MNKLNNIKEILNNRAEEVEKTLTEIMDLTDKEIAPTLTKAMQYTTFSGGKRIRPVLSLLTAEMLEGDLKAAKKAGAALELIHTYSLIHDDLPCMDDDKLRRGKATNHLVFGTGTATLAGDALLTYAFEILANLAISAENKIKLINLFASSAGYAGMVGGQVLDLKAEQRKLNLSEMKKIHRAKTGSLLKTAVLIGYYVSESKQENKHALIKYADNIGLVFQIVDDLLDITGDTETLGKTVGRDQALEKSTYPALLGVEGAKNEAEKVANQAKKALAIFGERAQVLSNLVDYLLDRNN